MANTAIQVQYRKEFVAGFEQRASALKLACTNEAVISGNQAVFLVADSGGAAAVTRGVNGLIPPRPDNLNQFTCTLVEWHDKPRRTKFNIFESQGNGRQIMQMTTQNVMNRKIDLDILSAMANTTTQLNSGVTATASYLMVQQALAKLANNEVDVDEMDKMWAVVSPAFFAYLMQLKEFVSVDWVTVKPLNASAVDINGRKVMRWAGVNWVKSARVTGRQTAAELCYFFHSDAVGHAVNVGDMDVVAGYNEEDSYYYARTSIFMGSTMLQNKGVVKITHDGSAFV